MPFKFLGHAALAPQTRLIFLILIEKICYRCIVIKSHAAIPCIINHKDIMGIRTDSYLYQLIKHMQKVLGLRGCSNFASHMTLADIVHHASDAIIGKSLDGTILSWNKAAEELFGYHKEEVIGKKATFLLQSSKCDEESYILSQVCLGNAINNFLTQRIHKNGKKITVSMSVSPIFDNQGAVIGLSKIIRDMKDEEELSFVSSHYKAIISGADDAIVSKNLHGDIMSWNKGAEDIFGYTQEEVLGKHITILIPRDRHAEENFILNRIMQGDKVPYFETIRQKKDGALINISASISPIRNDNGQIVGASKIARDISSEVRLRERLTIISNVFTHCGDAVVISDKNARIAEVNAAFERITGFEAKDFIGKKPELFRTSNGRYGLGDFVIQYLEKNDEWKGEFQGYKKSGEAFWGQMIVNTVRNPDGEIEWYVTLFSDITEKRNLVNRLKNLAHHDTLTGLSNRERLMTVLDDLVPAAASKPGYIGLAFIDLDNFKKINDSKGHQAGDQVLIRIANNIRCAVREQDDVYRIGGDEFVCLIRHLDSVDRAAPIVERIVESCRTKITIAGESIKLSASVGMIVYSGNIPMTASQLVDHADNAMYGTKKMGKDNFSIVVL